MSQKRKAVAEALMRRIAAMAGRVLDGRVLDWGALAVVLVRFLTALPWRRA
jgi:hypothetical protein